MRMQKRMFRIGELSKLLNLEKFVIRFWEKEFNIKSTRSSGGQRFYTQNDADLFSFIKTLLHQEGFTIAGARKKLTEIKTKKNIKKYKTTTLAQEIKKKNVNTKILEQSLLALQKKLIHLQKLL